MPGLILVLGSTGNIGKPLVKKLLDEGHRVRTATRNRPADEDPRAQWLPFDYAKPETHAAVFDGIERLFLLLPGAPNLVALTAQAIEAARRAGVRRIVKVSAFQAGPGASFSFGRWHHEADQLVAKSGIPYTVLRPNGFMQNYLGNYAASIRKQNVFYACTGDGKVSYLDARDIAASAAVALTEDGHEGKSYDLTGPEAISNHQVAALLSEVTGRQVRFQPVSDADATRALKGAGLPDWLVTALVELQTSYKNGEAAAISPAVQALTGREANSFQRFAQEFRAVFS